MPRPTFAALAFTVIAASNLHSQATPRIVDAGSFSLSIDGERVGREQFSIRELPGADGAMSELRAESVVGTSRSAYRLETDSSGAPLRYAVEIRDGFDVKVRVGGQRIRNRFTTLTRGPQFESAREYLLEPGIHVLDERVVHQYAGLLLDCRDLEVGETQVRQTLAPLASRRDSVQVKVEADDDAVVISGIRRPARRWRVISAAGESRIVWTDREGRILRLVIFGTTRFEALRDEVPR